MVDACFANQIVDSNQNCIMIKRIFQFHISYDQELGIHTIWRCSKVCHWLWRERSKNPFDTKP